MHPGNLSSQVTMISDYFRNLASKPVTKLPDVSERIRLRNLFGVTQATLANGIGVTRRTIHAWESGKSEPTGDNREKYAEVLNLWQELERNQER